MPGAASTCAHVDDRWAFRTAEDLAFVLKREVVEQRKLSRAALETLAIIAYHQPVTRAEIEEIRGVAISKGTLDVLLEAGWIRLRGRRRTPGRPVTFGTTPSFLDHFGLEAIGDLPGLADLKAAGLLETLAADRRRDAPQPDDDPDLAEDEDPLELDFLGLDERGGGRATTRGRGGRSAAPDAACRSVARRSISRADDLRPADRRAARRRRAAATIASRLTLGGRDAALRPGDGAGGRRPRHRAGRDRLAARPFRLRQDDTAADRRRRRGAERRPRARRRPRGRVADGLRAAGEALASA